MAEFARFFDSTPEDERYYTADEFAEYFRKVLSNGIFNGGTNLKVESTGANIQTYVQEGYAWIEGYLYKIEDGPVYLTHDLPDPTLDRIDRVVLRLDKSLEVRNINAKIIKGTPAASPVAPALTRNDNIYDIALAQVRIIKGKSYIEAYQITDERLDNTVCGLVNSLIQADTTAIFNQFQAWYNSKTTTFQQDWDTWFAGEKAADQAEWDNWYAAKTEALQSAWDSWFNTTKTNNVNSWNTWFDGVKSAWDTWFLSTKNSWATWNTNTQNGWSTWFSNTQSDWDDFFSAAQGESYLTGADLGVTVAKQSDLETLSDEIGSLSGNLNTHLAEAMPHKFTDTTDGRTYRYGFKTNAAKDGLVFVYEEVL